MCRFLSADVLLSTGQGVLGHNTFAYCNNNPVNAEDAGGCIPSYSVMETDGGGYKEREVWALYQMVYMAVYNTNEPDKNYPSYNDFSNSRGNCYQYATGTDYALIGGGCYFPGYTSGANEQERFSDAQRLADYIQKDLDSCYRREGRSFVVTPCESDYMPPEGAWKVAYCYGGGDFHFLRYDVGKGWSHKPGFGGIPTSNDFSGNRIYDLYEADLGQYNEETLLFLIIKEVSL